MQKIPRDIKVVTQLLDSKFQGPFNLRFGFDSLIGLVPFWGDILSTLASHYIVIRSIKIGCPPVVILRMLLNTYLDFFIGSIPLIGDIFDLYWKANSKNLSLIQDYYESPKKAKSASVLVMIFLTLLVLAILSGLLYCVYIFVSCFSS